MSRKNRIDPIGFGARQSQYFPTNEPELIRGVD